MRHTTCSNFDLSAHAALLVLLAVTGACPALGQIPVEGDEGGGGPNADIYVKPSGESAVVRAAPSPDGRVIDRIESNTVLITVSTEGEFEKVEPLAGSGLSWNSGYARSDQLEIDIDLPWRASVSAFGSVAAVTAGESVLSVGRGSAVQNPLGSPGTGEMFGVGLTVRGGYFIPVGKTGFKVRLDGEYLFVPGETQARSVDSTDTFMIRAGVGGNVVHRVTPMIDLSLGAIVGGGPVRNNLTLVSGRTISGTAWYGTGEVFAGVGYGRNRTTGVGIKGRIEGGYRFGTKLSGWSYDSEFDMSTALQSRGAALSVGGPFLRLMVGI
jgi:hypothetical protein